MKLKSISFLTLLAAMSVAGVNSAAAQDEVAFVTGNVIGATDNSSGWYGGKSEIFEIPADKTLTLKFKTYSATDEQLTAAGAGSWAAHMSHVINLWGGSDNLFWRADGYGWMGTNNTNGSGWFTFLGANTRWGTDGAEFREDITGSDVVMTIQRVGEELRMTQDFTATSGKYRRYFVVNYGTSTGSIWAQLAIERAHVVVTENYSITDTDVPAVVGTLVGNENNTSGFWTAWSDYFTIEPNKSLTLRFKNYTNRLNNWNGTVAYVTNDADRGAGGYTEYFGLRPDNWVNVANANATTCNYDVIGWDWAAFREKTDGATVTLTVTRNGADVKVREEFAPADGSTTLSEEYSQSCGDGTQTIRLFLTVEGGHADILPETATVGATGWATFSSSVALDFSAVSGLKAYIVTGHVDDAVTVSQLTGTVPAGTGLLLEGDADIYSIPVVGSSTTDVSANLLVAGADATVSAEAGKTKYALSSAEGKAVFKKIDTYSPVIAKGKAYLVFNEVIEAPQLTFDFNGTSAINTVKTEGTDGIRYNLAGRQVSGSYRGVVIENGRKAMVK